jgi:alpha-tubulin suppressor-like RCC1 family protein
MSSLQKHSWKEMIVRTLRSSILAAVIFAFLPMAVSASEVKVATGVDHTVVILSDGSLWAWGANSNGQVGDGTINNRLTPFQVSPGSTWTDVTAGKFYTVAIKSDGTLWAWGINTYGTLGDGTYVDRLVPVQIGAHNDWAAVSAGSDHTLALKKNGTLWAWGRNQACEIGNGNKLIQAVPVQIGMDTDWSTIGAGSSHSHAIKTNGALWGWGANGYGQLGNGDDDQSCVPIRIGTDSDWKFVAGANKHALAIKRDDTLWAWGDNMYGQLGTGSTIGTLIPIRIHNYEGTWATVSPGKTYTLAITSYDASHGELWSWGDNTYGQLGNGAIGVPQNFPWIAVGGPWLRVSAGEKHGAAIFQDNSIQTWGNNELGQLGNGTTEQRLLPSRIASYLVTMEAGGKGTFFPCSPWAGVCDGVPSTTKPLDWGASAWLKIVPNSGYGIDTVSGCNGTLSGDSYTTGPITADCTVTATFVKIYTVTATAGQYGSITPSGAVTVTEGATTTFTITPNDGAYIDTVTGCNGTLTGNIYTTGPITADCAVNATFKIKTYTLKASAGANGTITPSGDVVVTHGSGQIFTMAPAAGYHVAEVLIDGAPAGISVSDPPLSRPVNYTFTNVTAGHTISATFAANPSVTITVSAGANGSISPSGPLTVLSETDQTFTITPATGYFVEDVLVDGASAGAVTTYTFNKVMTNHTISATFRVARQFTIEASAGENGAISPSGAVPVTEGTNKSFNITPATGYRTASVIVDGVNQGATNFYSFANITSDHKISATFSPTITSTADANGAISPRGTLAVDAGSTMSYTITPYAGYHVADIVIDGVSTGISVTDPPLSRSVVYTFTNITAPHTINAVIAPNPTYIISATAAAEGTISPSGEVAVLGETNKSFTITPASGYKTSVLIDGQNYGSITFFTFSSVTSNHSISVSFLPTITSSSGANGMISPRGTLTVQPGSDMAYTMTANTGYHIADVLVDGVSVGAVASYTFANVTVPHTINVVFEQNPTYIITATAAANGTITPSGDVAVLGGTSKSFTITPNSGYKTSVLIDGQNYGSITFFNFSNVTSNHTISVSFLPTITSSSSANGMISPRGTLTVQPGSDMTYTMIPNTGYHIADVLVDGVSVGAVAFYTFTNVMTPHTINVTFEANPTYIITATAAANGTITPSGDVAVLGGTNKSFTITPASGYKSSVFIDGQNYGSVTFFTFSNVTSNHTISVSFLPTITSSSGANGMISPRGTLTVQPGSDMTYTMIPNTGYHIADVLVDGVSVGPLASYTFTNVTRPHTIDVAFALD